MPTIQPTFRLNLRVHRPMMSIATALTHLEDVTEDDVVAWIEEGKLQWAFNIASRDAKAREVRILSACIHAAQREEAFDESFEQVLARIIPPAVKGKPWLTLNPQVITAIHCMPTHGIDLLLEGEFETVRNNKPKRGPNGSPLITRESFVAFLKERRM